MFYGHFRSRTRVSSRGLELRNDGWTFFERVQRGECYMSWYVICVIRIIWVASWCFLAPQQISRGTVTEPSLRNSAETLTRVHWLTSRQSRGFGTCLTLLCQLTRVLGGFVTRMGLNPCWLLIHSSLMSIICCASSFPGPEGPLGNTLQCWLHYCTMTTKLTNYRALSRSLIKVLSHADKDASAWCWNPSQRSI